MRNWMRIPVAVICLSGALMVSSCSNSPSEEELSQLEMLRKDVAGLEAQLKDKNNQKGTLEKQVAEKNGKLQQCQADQDAVKKATGGQ